MNKKAIKIDLSTFFDDERKMTCVLVDPSWKSVACLQQRVEFLFDVDSVRFLSDGYFLPPQESIEIIKFCNDLKAFVPKESLEKRKKKKAKKCKAIENSSEDETTQNIPDDSQVKRKLESLGCGNPPSSLSNKAKRSKNCNTFSEITSTSEPIPPVPEVSAEEIKSKKSKVKKSKVSVREEHNLENETFGGKSEIAGTENMEEEISSDHDNSHKPKKRLTSTPKKNKTIEFEDNTVEKTFNDEMKATEARPSSIPSSTFLNESKLRNNVDSPNLNNPFKKPKTSKAHIYFNESGEMLTPMAVAKSKKKNDEETKTIVIFRCPLSEVTNGTQPQKPRIFNLISKNTEVNNKNKKQIVEIQEQIILSPLKKQNSPKSPIEEKSVITEIEKQQQTTIETSEAVEETDSLSDKSSINNTSIATDSTTIVKNVDEEPNNKTTNATQSQNESQADINESSIMSVDCVDLSIEIDDDDNELNKKKTTKKNMGIKSHEKLDLTADDEDNDSSSDVQEVSEIIDLNETDDNCDITANTSKALSNSINDIRVDQILPFSTNLTGLPKIGDIVIFKMPYTNKKHQQFHTAYLAGKVEYINRRIKSIKLLIVDGNSELCHVPSQYRCNLDDTQDNMKYVQLKLSEMFEPKLFSMA